MPINAYVTDSNGPVRKRKGKPENNRTNAFLKLMYATGATAVWRFRDDSMVHQKFDGYIHLKGMWMPFEAKRMKGGKTFNSKRWRENQEHQYRELDRLSRFGENIAPFFLLHFKNSSGRWKFLAHPIELMDADKIEISKMWEISKADDIISMICES